MIGLGITADQGAPTIVAASMSKAARHIERIVMARHLVDYPRD